MMIAVSLGTPTSGTLKNRWILLKDIAWRCPESMNYELWPEIWKGSMTSINVWDKKINACQVWPSSYLCYTCNSFVWNAMHKLSNKQWGLQEIWTSSIDLFQHVALKLPNQNIHWSDDRSTCYFEITQPKAFTEVMIVWNYPTKTFTDVMIVWNYPTKTFTEVMIVWITQLKHLLKWW